MSKDNDAVLIPRYLLGTLTPAGYFQYFYRAVQVSALSHREAWEAIEADREAHGLPPGYDSYHSCRNAKYHHRGKLFRLLDGE